MNKTIYNDSWIKTYLQNVKIEALENFLTKVQNQPKSEVEQTGNITDRVRAVEELVEERTNQQLHKTLVIRGVPEQQHEKWNDTDTTLSTIIAKTMDIPLQEAG